MQIWIVRALFAVLFAAVAYLIGQSLSAVLWGIGIIAVLVAVEFSLKRVLFRDILACLVGISIGLIVAKGWQYSGPCRWV